MRAIGLVVLVAVMSGCASEVGGIEPEQRAVDAGQLAPDAGPAVVQEGPSSAPDGGVAPDAACKPACPPGVSCGVADDGCGGKMECGTCSGSDSCGGGGTPGQCGCTPVDTCKTGSTCGWVPDNCGHEQNCLACPAGGLCENSACLTLTSLGCGVWPACMAEAGGVCVLLAGPSGSTTIYGCPSSAPLPTDLCSPFTSGPGASGGWLQCCPTLGCKF